MKRTNISGYYFPGFGGVLLGALGFTLFVFLDTANTNLFC